MRGALCRRSLPPPVPPVPVESPPAAPFGSPGVSDLDKGAIELALACPPPDSPSPFMALTAADETMTPEGSPGLLIDCEIESGRCEDEPPLCCEAPVAQGSIWPWCEGESCEVRSEGEWSWFDC